MQRRLSVNAKAQKVHITIDDYDFISKLPDDLLEMILQRLSIEEAMKTSVLSMRWVHLWKQRPDLVLDMGERLTTVPPNLKQEVSVHLAKAMNKVIKNHRGNLESCILHNYSSKCSDGILHSWIDTAILKKHTKDLQLINHGDKMLNFHPHRFSNQSLTSLSLSRYILLNTSAFKNCSNIKTLKLFNITIPHVSVLSSVFEACSSLEVLIMQIDPLTRGGVLKINNSNLKVLQFFSSHRFDRMEVYAVCLDVLDIKCIICERDQFLLDAPNLRFNNNYWLAGNIPHISYNISNIPQEKIRIWHGLMVNEVYAMRQGRCLSVSVDVTNLKEVETLKELFRMWTAETMELEIYFKRNKKPRREGECYISSRAPKNFWEDAKLFPSIDFHVHTLWMSNFDGSNEEEMALVSHFVTHKGVIEKMMIRTSSFPPMKKLKAEANVAKLIKLSKGNRHVSIKCF